METFMKKYILTLPILFTFSLLLVGCATSSLETAQMRDRDYNVSKITLTQNGLSQAEINSISKTKYPTEFPIDFSIVLMKDYYVDNSMEQIFLK